MSLLDTASLIVTPNGYKEGKLYSVIPSDGSGDLSVTRATTATRVNSAGLVELVPYNIVNYSEQFDNAAWTKVDASVTANTTTAPDGTLTADTITDNSTLDRHITYQSLDSERSLTRTLSTYAKQGTLRYLALSVTITSDSTACYSAIFDLQTGTITATKNNGSATISASIENAGNGWYRCIISGALGNGFETIYPVIATSDRAGFTGSLVNNNLPIYAGSGQSLYIWGAQLNEGSLKDYQKTETRLNIPRLDYSNGTCPSILVEPQRTNLVTWSSSFDNAAWIKLNGSVTANATTSPSGIQDADSFIPNTTSGFHALRSNNFNQSSTASHSWFLKANGYSKIAVRESDLPIGNYASFDLSTGTLISTSQSGIIEDYGNGWYRCALVDTNTGAGAQTSIFVLPDNYTTGDPLIAWSGDGIKGVFAYGAQAELGSYPTSYIPTTSASVTRNADVISKTGISSLIGQTEGTCFVDFIHNGADITTFQAALFVSSGDSSNLINIGVYDGRLNPAINASSVGIFDVYVGPNPLPQGRHKVAIAYKSGDFAIYLNGTQVYTNTDSATFGTMSQVDLGTILSLNRQLGDGINAAALWKTRLTNTQLAALTTI
jgi:hypothetical protein